MQPLPTVVCLNQPRQLWAALQTMLNADMA
jgi:hypothetical protein